MEAAPLFRLGFIEVLILGASGLVCLCVFGAVLFFAFSMGRKKKDDESLE